MPLMNYAFFESNWWEQALFPALSMHQELFWNKKKGFAEEVILLSPEE